jgi:hypothetical protein
LGGTKLGRHIPRSTTLASHTASSLSSPNYKMILS